MDTNSENLEMKKVDEALAKITKMYNKKLDLHSHPGQECIEESQLQNNIERKESLEEIA